MSFVRRILIICNTYFQVIVAIQLRLTLFKHEEVDVHISDHSINAETVANRLRRTGMFCNVCYRETRSEIGLNKFRKAGRFVEACFGIGRYPVYSDYDEIIFYNLNIPVYHVADSAMNGSKDTVYSGMEEGVLSYGKMAYGKSPNLLDKIRAVTGHPQIKKRIAAYYCFNPKLFRLYGEKLKPVCIPSVSNTLTDLKSVLTDVFSFEAEPIRQRFVFFASSSDVDGCGFGETELVMEIAKFVGRDNLLVKMHPRDGRSIYEKAGLTVMTQSDIPWEVVQICGGAEGVIYLTATSGAFINSAALFDSDTKGFFLRFDHPNNTKLAERMRSIEMTLRYLHESETCEGIRIVDKENALEVLRPFLAVTPGDGSEGEAVRGGI